MVGRGPPPPLLDLDEIASPIDGVTLSPRKSGMRSRFVKPEPPSPIEIMKEWVINSPKMRPAMDPPEEVLDEDDAESYVMENKNWLLLELGSPKMANKKAAGNTGSHWNSNNVNNACSSVNEESGLQTTSTHENMSLLKEWGQAILACGSDVLKSQQKRLEPALESKHWFDAMHACSPMHADSEHHMHTDIFHGWGSLDESESASTGGPSPDELGQIRRLTSWGTIFSGDDDTTVGTIPLHNDYRPNDDFHSYINKNRIDNSHQVTPIPDKESLTPKAGVGGSGSKSLPKRKRVVRFDYPPISSLRECPRAAPEDLENLFFTAQELDMIEEDRFSTMSADDVEIVAISSSGEEDGGNRQAFGFNENTENRAPSRGGSAGTPRRKSSSNGSRMIKSVQIYLRERSGG